MAKGGGKRAYTRDSNGRFASGGGKSGAMKGGTLAARSSLKRSKAKNVPGLRSLEAAGWSCHPRQIQVVQRNGKLQATRASHARRDPG